MRLNINLYFSATNPKHVQLYNLLKTKKRKTDFLVDKCLEDSTTATREDVWEAVAEIRSMINGITINAPNEAPENAEEDFEDLMDL